MSVVLGQLLERSHSQIELAEPKLKPNPRRRRSRIKGAEVKDKDGLKGFGAIRETCYVGTDDLESIRPGDTEAVEENVKRGGYGRGG
jgi:hypothetical protein